MISQDEFRQGAKDQLQAALSSNQADIRVWDLCTDVPRVKNIFAYLCLVLNILVPGTGTMVAACIGDFDAKGNKT